MNHLANPLFIREAQREETANPTRQVTQAPTESFTVGLDGQPHLNTRFSGDHSTQIPTLFDLLIEELLMRQSPFPGFDDLFGGGGGGGTNVRRNERFAPRDSIGSTSIQIGGF